jgi:hypothetical protein
MEARSVDAIPQGREWQYEPKWDGFRCLLSRERSDIQLRSKSNEDLTRYFPEFIDAALRLKAISFVLDGEIVVPHGRGFSFDDLLQRIHPAASRVQKLAKETPALFIAFDLLRTAKDKRLAEHPLNERRPTLEAFAKANFKSSASFRLSSATPSYALAKKWLAQSGGGCDGVIAKRIDLPYQAGNRDGMQKIKRFRSADCVIGGFRYASNKIAGRKVVGSLLLGLYDDDGLLHHVGFTSAIKNQDKPALTGQLEPLIAKPGFTGNAPGGPSRWSTERSARWCPMKRRAFPPRHLDPALASRQVAAAVQLRSTQAKGCRSEEGVKRMTSAWPSAILVRSAGLSETSRAYTPRALRNNPSQNAATAAACPMRSSTALAGNGPHMSSRRSSIDNDDTAVGRGRWRRRARLRQVPARCEDCGFRTRYSASALPSGQPHRRRGEIRTHHPSGATGIRQGGTSRPSDASRAASKDDRRPAIQSIPAADSRSGVRRA